MHIRCLLQEEQQIPNISIALHVPIEPDIFQRIILEKDAHIIPAFNFFHDGFQPFVHEHHILILPSNIGIYIHIFNFNLPRDLVGLSQLIRFQPPLRGRSICPEANSPVYQHHLNPFFMVGIHIELGTIDP